MIITPSQYFPLLLIALNLCASISYAYGGDYRRAMYWVFAAGLTVTVTF